MLFILAPDTYISQAHFIDSPLYANALYIINGLHLPDNLAGIMMGVAAGLEIPVMLIAGYYAKK